MKAEVLHRDLSLPEEEVAPDIGEELRSANSKVVSLGGGLLPAMSSP